MKKIENKYFRWYWNICENAKKRKLPKETYTEKHHIYPKSLYPEQTDLVSLTAKEHYIVHLLLWRGFRYEYGVSDERTRKMACAFTMMNRISKDNKGRKNIDNSNEYSFLRIAYSEINVNKIISTEIRKKLSERAKLRFSVPQNNPMYGKKHSNETKKKISDNNKNLFKDIDNHPMYGKNHSDETKRKISEKMKNKIPWNKNKILKEKEVKQKDKSNNFYKKKTF